MKTRLWFLLLFLSVCHRAQALPPAFPPHALVMEGFQGVLWVQTSVEHRALCRQTFLAARAQLQTALADPNWTAALEQQPGRSRLPPAVIVDIDETVLDNSPFHGTLLKTGHSFSTELFRQWVEAARAKALPGAVAFTQAAKALGIEVFYVTNRSADEEQATRLNLAREGFPVADKVDTVLMRKERPEWLWDKTTRRAAIARNYRILLLIGDDFNDFVSGARTSIGKRLDLSEKYQAHWGTRWFVVPNPTYGSWLGAIYDYEWGMTPDEKRQRRRETLDVFTP